MTRYEVLERIGAGRMAEIFRGKAIAAGGFEKPVAIKRILPHLSSDPRFVELLIAEAKILSVLRHRNVVQIFDVGVGDDGHHFLVMEFVDGTDLGALQRHLEAHRQRLPIDLVLHVGAEVCEALDHAQHGSGPDGKPMRLVHRDVTPTNVLVSRAGEVKLTDFGLAKRPEDSTSAGGLRGRFGYVSPEQASGLPVDGRADVFAVGVIMWELALGRRLFSGLADFDALRAVREGTIARVREQDPSLPADLDAILVEALAQDPKARLPNAGELGKRLRGLRYSLEDSSGDPSAALARLVAGVERAPPPAAVEPSTAPRPKERGKRTSASFDGVEPTVLRIRTADGFADDREGTGLVAARRVLDHFEEEQTRMSRLPSSAFEEISTVGGSARAYHDSGEVPAQHAPLHLRDSGEVLAQRAPLHIPRDSGEITAPAAAPLELDDGPREPRRSRAVRAPSRAEPPRAEPPRAEPPRAEPRDRDRAGKTPPPVPTRPAPSSSPDLRGPAARAAAAPPPPPEPRPTARAAAAPPPSSGPAPRPPSLHPAAMPPPEPATVPAYSRPPTAPAPSASSSSPALYPGGSASFSAATPQRPSHPHARPGTASVGRPGTAHPALGFARPQRRWWTVGVAAVVIAALSFLITRAALDPAEIPTGAAAAPDAGPALDAAAAVPLATAVDATTVDAAPLDAASPDAATDAGPDDALTDDAIPGDATAPDDAATSDATAPDDASTATADAAAPARVEPAPPRRRPPARKPPRKKKRR